VDKKSTEFSTLVYGVVNILVRSPCVTLCHRIETDSLWYSWCCSSICHDPLLPFIWGYPGYGLCVIHQAHSWSTLCTFSSTHPSITRFSMQSVLCMMCLKYDSFCLIIIASSDHVDITSLINNNVTVL